MRLRVGNANEVATLITDFSGGFLLADVHVRAIIQDFTFCCSNLIPALCKRLSTNVMQSSILQ